MPDDAATSPRMSTEAVVAALEEDIVLGRLHPRERLIEEDLSTRFDVSRHVLRQALVELDRMGLVERLPNRGAQVRAMSLDEVDELYQMRDLLEQQAAMQIALPVAPEAMAELRAIQARHDAAIEAGDPVAGFRANHLFHQTLFGLCGNRFLAEAIGIFAQRAHGMRFYVLNQAEARRCAQAEHHQMLAALEAGERDTLAALCRAHLRPSRAAWLAAFGIAGAGP